MTEGWMVMRVGGRLEKRQGLARRLRDEADLLLGGGRGREVEVDRRRPSIERHIE